MKYLKNILIFSCFLGSINLSIAEENNNYTCYKRGFEIIFPYQHAIDNIKKNYIVSSEQKKKELLRFKKSFEKNFFGIPLYKEAGCSNARLSEYLDCLIISDGKDCRIYYTQMRIVD